MTSPRTTTRLAWLATAMLSFACSDDGSGPADDPRLSDPLLDPETCKECHPKHHRQWLGSMHAYAAEDPVFRAMNARGQRETNGTLGDFCVQCHAPMAVELGLTEDGLNLDEIPQKFQGVTCYFCHTVAAVEDTHNNPLRLSGEGVMLGAIRDPVPTDAHESAYSPFLDQATLESADMCGSCHDIVNDNGVHLERTYAEWLDSFMSDRDPLSGQAAVYGQRCGSCHMGPASTEPVADAEGVRGDRSFHPHSMAGVDIALTDFPDATLGPELRAEQLAEMQEQRKTALCASLCVQPDEEGDGSIVDVYLHNEFTAHAWPSGATQDRRAWLELEGFTGDELVLQSGKVPEGTSVDDLEDSSLWLFRSFMYDDAGKEVHQFWEAQSNEEFLLPASDILSPEGDASTWRARRFRVDDRTVDRVGMRVLLRPMALSILDELIESGDLDPAIREAMPLFEVAPTMLEWTPDAAEPSERYGACVSSSGSCGITALQTDVELPTE